MKLVSASWPVGLPRTQGLVYVEAPNTLNAEQLPAAAGPSTRCEQGRERHPEASVRKTSRKNTVVLLVGRNLNNNEAPYIARVELRMVSVRFVVVTQSL